MTIGSVEGKVVSFAFDVRLNNEAVEFLSEFLLWAEDRRNFDAFLFAGAALISNKWQG